MSTLNAPTAPANDLTTGHDAPAVRRIVTGHDENGHAIVQSDTPVSLNLTPVGDAKVAQVWSTATVPADTNDTTDGAARLKGHTISGGSVLRLVDILPGCGSPMHRTSSVDYGFVLSGEIQLELDDGSTTGIGPGGIIVQRGTMHRWYNASDSVPCRMAFVLIEAAPYVHEGQVFEEVHF